ncbi:MAG: hypothetical protein ABSA02_19510 [Trebonia sp.]
MLLAEKDLVGAQDDVVQQDPEVRQARKIADAARSRLLTCVAGAEAAVDLSETQRIFELLGEAQALVEDAEDRVLVHRGLLTPAEAGRRAAARRPAPPGASAPPAPERAQDTAGVAGPAHAAGLVARCAEAGTRALKFSPGRVPALPPAARRVTANVIIHALIPAAAGFAGAAIARRRR